MGSLKKPDVHGVVYPHLCFVIDETRISHFFLLLQQGVTVLARVGCSVKIFVNEEIGVGPDTMEKVQSIFLDGRPVDDLDSAMIKDGSRLTLSAAMPGLVGATLRRGGAYSSFRDTITYHETAPQCASGEGFVQVKLFNLMMDELGPGFLRKGVYISSSDLRDFLAGKSSDFWQGCRQVLLDGKQIETGSLEERGWLSHHDWFFLSVAIPQ